MAKDKTKKSNTKKSMYGVTYKVGDSRSSSTPVSKALNAKRDKYETEERIKSQNRGGPSNTDSYEW